MSTIEVMFYNKYPSYLRRNSMGPAGEGADVFDTVRTLSNSVVTGQPTSYYMQTQTPATVGLAVQRRGIIGRHTTVTPNDQFQYTLSGAWRSQTPYQRMVQTQNAQLGNSPAYTRKLMETNLALGKIALKYSTIPVEGVLNSELITGSALSNRLAEEPSDFGANVNTLAEKIKQFA